MEMYKKLMNGE
jgi:hypothetical protein